MLSRENGANHFCFQVYKSSIDFSFFEIVKQRRYLILLILAK